jgi:hypothetical protein
VDVSRLKEGTSLATNKDHGSGEVRVNIKIPLLVDGTFLDSTYGSSVIIVSHGGSEASGELKDVCYLGATN